MHLAATPLWHSAEHRCLPTSGVARSPSIVRDVLYCLVYTQGCTRIATRLLQSAISRTGLLVDHIAKVPLALQHADICLAQSSQTLLRSLILCTSGPQVFSFFEYSSQCSKRKLRVPMEPLVGMLRHPFVIPVCRPEVRPAASRLTHLQLVGQNWSRAVQVIQGLTSPPMMRDLCISLHRLTLLLRSLRLNPRSGSQKHDLLIDTAHDKPQAPEGPQYHIENKGAPPSRSCACPC